MSHEQFRSEYAGQSKSCDFSTKERRRVLYCRAVVCKLTLRHPSERQEKIRLLGRGRTDGWMRQPTTMIFTWIDLLLVNILWYRSLNVTTLSWSVDTKVLMKACGFSVLNYEIEETYGLT